jgi:predicted translin family RNA/ssDNA-binding protein
MKTIKFIVATDPALYGPDATPQDVQEFAAFAYQYLQKQSYDEVEVEFVEKYPRGNADSQGELRKQIWSAFRGE